jgi:hypothetical protein
MSQVTVVNNSPESIMLDDGTVIGAAYTTEARREGVVLSAQDRERYVDVPGPRLTVVEGARQEVSRATPERPAAPPAEEAKPERRGVK